MAEYEDGWFYGYSPADELEFHGQDDHRYVKRDTRNVVGRFRDHSKIDGHASREAKREVHRPIIILETRNLKTAHGSGTDISVLEIRFDHDMRRKSVEAVERFKDAWAAYQAVRTVPVTEDEAEVLGTAPKAEKPKAPRKPRAKKADNVVALKTASA